MLRALSGSDQEALRAAAHGFKGASANLGFAKLAALAFQFEKSEYLPEIDNRAHLLEAWDMTHALCLRMGLTDVAAIQERHRPVPKASSQQGPLP